MLKFLFDDKKKAAFLDFWKLSDLDAFATQTKDPLSFGFQYNRLGETEKKILAYLICEEELGPKALRAEAEAKIEATAEAIDKIDKIDKIAEKTSREGESPKANDSIDPSPLPPSKPTKKSSPKKTPGNLILPQVPGNSKSNHSVSVKALLEETKGLSPDSIFSILERLDDLHFINWLKNRSGLSESKDIIELTQEVRTFIQTTKLLTSPDALVASTKQNNPADFSLKKRDKKFKPQEWDVLVKLILFYAVPLEVIARSERLKALIVKALDAHIATLGIYAHSGELHIVFPVIHHAHKLRTKDLAASVKPLPLAKVQSLKKNLTEKLFTLTAFVYELRTKESAVAKHIPIKNEAKRKPLLTLARDLLKTSNWNNFLRSSPYAKVFRALEIGSQESLSLLREIAEIILPAAAEFHSKSNSNANSKLNANSLNANSLNANANSETSDAPSQDILLTLKERELLLMLNQNRFWKKQSYLRELELKELLIPLQNWHLVEFHQDSLEIHIGIIAQILNPNPVDTLIDLPADDVLIMDSDMSMTVFNETSSLATLHFLSLFSKIVFSEHVTQCTPNLDFSHLSWFAGLNSEITFANLKELAKDTFSQQAQEYFQLYFQHIILAKVSQVLLLQASSTQVFLKLKYALKEAESFHGQVIFIEDTNAIVFTKEQDYLEAKEQLMHITKIF